MIYKCYWIVGKTNARVCSVFSAKIEFQRRMCSICMCDQVWPIKEGIIEIIPFYLCRVIDREMPFVCAFSPWGKNTRYRFPIWFETGNTKHIINKPFKCITESFSGIFLLYQIYIDNRPRPKTFKLIKIVPFTLLHIVR